MVLKAGTPAPDFSLRSTPDQAVSLREFRGHPVVLVFYPADWSPVCGDQLDALQRAPARVRRLRRHAARHLGRRRRGATWRSPRPQAALPAARRLRAQGRGRARSTACTAAPRASASAPCSSSTATGVIRWSYVSPIGVNPGADGILDALEAARRSRRSAAIELAVRDCALPVSERDHMLGPAERAGHAGRVRRLRVPALRRGLPGRGRMLARARATRLRFVYRHFPLTSVHPHAQRAAEAAEAAGAQGAFWPMHDLLFEHQDAPGRRGLLGVRRGALGPRRGRASPTSSRPARPRAARARGLHRAACAAA